MALWLAASVLVLITTLAGSEPRFGGTFIGAMICEDGIIVASDSRSTFEDAARRPVGYVDGMAKIFVREGAAFAVSGLTSVGNELFGSFVRRNEFLLDRPANEMLFGVALWLPFQNSTNVMLLSAGFVDGEAMICARSPNAPQACRKSGYVTNKESASLASWYAEKHGVLTAQNAALALKQAILESAAGDRTVGGPITILYLPKAGSLQWLENPPRDNGWTEVCDLVNDYRRGRVQIGFTNSKEELTRYLAGVCPAKAR